MVWHNMEIQNLALFPSKHRKKGRLLWLQVRWPTHPSWDSCYHRLQLLLPFSLPFLIHYYPPNVLNSNFIS